VNQVLRSPFPIILVLVFSAAALRAQVNPRPSPTPKSEEQEPVRVFTEEVRLPVAATDTYGHYDPTLAIDDVLILEDGQPQQIRSIQHLAANVLLLLDTGNELGLKDTKLTRDVAMRIVSALHPGDRIAIMQFATRPELLQRWTTDRSAIAKVLKTKLNSGKTSRLASAIAAASDEFKETPAGTRHIVLITDGVDVPGGQVTMTSALRKLNSIQVSVQIVS
jgi:Mg-chelatase subunit ChlD